MATAPVAGAYRREFTREAIVTVPGPIVRVSIIVPVKNKALVLEHAMRSIVAAVRAANDCELIAIEHGSTDGSTEILRRLVNTSEIHELRGGTIAHARNVGAAKASGDIFLFLDCDVEIPVDYPARLVSAIAATGADSIGAPVSLPDAPTWVERAWHLFTIDERRGERHFLNSANVAFTRRAFDRVGGFPEELETGEDWEISRRLRALGGKVMCEPALIAKHLDNPKSIAAFYRKERWYGKGMVGASEKNRINLTTAATIAFAVIVMIGTISALMAFTLGVLAAAILLVGLAAATFVFRRRSTGRWGPASAFVLVPVFYAARLSGMLATLVSTRAPSPRVARS